MSSQFVIFIAQVVVQQPIANIAPETIYPSNIPGIINSWAGPVPDWAL
jgi:hypothetical protein